jgi:hypothetical protein
MPFNCGKLRALICVSMDLCKPPVWWGLVTDLFVICCDIGKFVIVTLCDRFVFSLAT